MKKLRIAMYTPFFFPSIGGVQYAVLELSRGMQKKGHEVTVFTFIRDKHVRESETIQGIQVQRYPVTSIPFVRGQLYSKELIRAIAGFDCDIVHLHNYSYLPFLISMANSIRVPIVLTSHSLMRNLEFYKSRITPWGVSFLGKILSKRLSGVVALTDAEVNLFCEAGFERDKIHVIPNGVDIEQYRNSLDRYKPDKNLIISVNRFDKIKRLEDLIFAMDILSQKYPKLRCAIFGSCRDKAYFSMIKKLVSERKNIWLDTNQKNKMKYFGKGSFFVHPGINEGFGLVLLEAMASRIPVVAVKSGGIPCIIQDGVNGIIVPPKDPKAIAEAVSSLIDDCAKRKRIIRNAESYVSGFDWSAVTDKTMELYYRCLNV